MGSKWRNDWVKVVISLGEIGKLWSQSIDLKTPRLSYLNICFNCIDFSACFIISLCVFEILIKSVYLEVWDPIQPRSFHKKINCAFFDLEIIFSFFVSQL